MYPSPAATSREWRFLSLALLLAAWMLLSPHFHRWFVQLLLQLLFLSGVRVTLWANPEWRTARKALVALWVLSLAGSSLAYLPGERWSRLGLAVEAASTMPLLVLLAAGILKFVFGQRRLTVDGIFATVVVYLLVAFLFAQSYLLLITIDPSCFSLPVPAAERPPHLLQIDLLYFSLVTLATVGYGDILPVGETARMAAMLEAVVGQFYVAVIVAVFVGMYMAQRRE